MTDTMKEGEMPDVIKYLLGEGQLDGCSYPDFPDSYETIHKRRYWWRKHLREAWNTRAVCAPEVEAIKREAVKFWRTYETGDTDNIKALIDHLHQRGLLKSGA